MKKYDPAKIEKKWLKIWQKKPLYKAIDPPAGGAKKKKFYGLVEFPYPSGEGLHMGHAFTNTILDVLVRKKRREGFNVLYPMGWDAFGLPTENYAVKTGIHPAEVTKRNTDRFRKQMKRLGLAYNWEREVNTTDPDYYRWTQWVFLQFFKHGLAYKKKMAINWCPSCKIGLANEEVVGGQCERCGAGVKQRELEQWLLRITAYADRLADELDLVDYPDYVKASQRNWIGRSEGTTIKFVIADFSPRQFIEVFTTRPDTLFGVTAMVLAPEHPLTTLILQAAKNTVRSRIERNFRSGISRFKEIKAYVEQAKKKSELERTDLAKEKTGVFTGFYCINPINNESVPIWIGDYVVASYGGGAVMVVPAHDQRDFAFARRHNLEIKLVVVPPNTNLREFQHEFTRINQAYEDYGILVNSGKYTGLTSQEAIRKITDDLVKKDLAKRVVQYHLRDWIFSRQRYWGEPIPMIYCPTCAKKGISWWETKKGKAFLKKHQISSTKSQTNSKSQIQNSKQFENWDLKIENSSRRLAGWFPLSEDQLPLKLPKVKKYQPTGTGESPLAALRDWVKVACPECGRPARRETDTMPNWAGSSWYFLAYAFGHHLRGSKPPIPPIRDRKNSPIRDRSLAAKPNVFKKHQDLLNYWMPVDLYLGGAEHTTLHLLYSRFWHKFLNDIGAAPGKEPYQARRQHGVILGEDGFRMSKSRGNVINPEEVVKKYGADTLRVYLMFMGPYDQTMAWNTKGLEGAHRFLKRVWRLAAASVTRHPDPDVTSGEGSHSSKGGDSSSDAKGRIQNDVVSDEKFWLHKTIKKVTEDIEDLSFNTAIAALMELVNFLSKKPTKDTSKETIEILVKLLAPFAPFMAEELWFMLRHPERSEGSHSSKGGDSSSPPAPQNDDGMKWSVHLQPWPKYDPKFIKKEETMIVVQVNGRVRDKIKLDTELANFTSRSQKEKVKKLALFSDKIRRHLRSREVKKVIYVPGRLVNLVVK